MPLPSPLSAGLRSGIPGQSVKLRHRKPAHMAYD